jgi:streptogramin lyase
VEITNSVKTHFPTLSRRTLLGTLAVFDFRAQAAEPLIANLTQTGAVNNPYGLRLGPDGALYICEIGNHRISRLDLQTRKLTVVLDGQKEPYDLRFDREGILYFNDMPAHQIRSLNLKTGETRLIAGTGEPGFSGDGGPAAKAQFKQPHSIAFDPAGRLLVCDIGNHRIRSIDLKTGIITTFAGTGEQGATPEGAPRSGTPINGPRAIDFGSDGTLYLVLREGNAIHRLDPKTDQFHRVAGTGEKGYSGDGADARQAKLSGPKAIACAPDASIYIADTESHTIRRISRSGIISTVAGTGERGDGPTGDPLKCKLSRPHGVFVDQAGIIYIGDSESHRVRKIAKY